MTQDWPLPCLRMVAASVAVLLCAPKVFFSHPEGRCFAMALASTRTFWPARHVILGFEGAMHAGLPSTCGGRVRRQRCATQKTSSRLCLFHTFGGVGPVRVAQIAGRNPAKLSRQRDLSRTRDKSITKTRAMLGPLCGHCVSQKPFLGQIIFRLAQDRVP